MLRDNGYSPLITKWDHVITAQEVSGGTLYRDRVTIEAGILTPFVWLFARQFTPTVSAAGQLWRQMALATEARHAQTGLLT